MAKKTEKRWSVRLSRAVPYEGAVLSPKDRHEVSDAVLAQLGDAVAEKEEVEPIAIAPIEGQ